jgi:tagatose-6-phosphate ketose/aldose isomerase
MSLTASVRGAAKTAMTGADPRGRGPEGSADAIAVPSSVDDWLASFPAHGPLGELLARPPDEQLRRGYGHTLREIAQQPVTWTSTADSMRGLQPLVQDSLRDASAVVVTGSGSSLYAAECVAPGLQRALGVPVSAVAAGLILTHPDTCLPPRGPFLLVSLARSGNSPESRAVVDSLLEDRPHVRHLLITCNSGGALATSYRDRAEVRTIVLDERTHDRSLVMTSSFTNLVLAGRALGGNTSALQQRTRGLARTAAGFLRDRAPDLAAAARSFFGSALYLGSGCRVGSAREAALKMTEMNAGEVWSYAESYLGLRHGPMSAIRPDTLVVAFLSSDPLVRAYEHDLLGELDRKSLGGGRVVVGAEVPAALAAGKDTVVLDCGSRATAADEDLTLLDAVVGQLLAFFRCLEAGYRPDSPSEGDVITRVVSGFEIHRRNG